MPTRRVARSAERRASGHECRAPTATRRTTREGARSTLRLRDPRRARGRPRPEGCAGCPVVSENPSPHIRQPRGSSSWGVRQDATGVRPGLRECALTFTLHVRVRGPRRGDGGPGRERDAGPGGCGGERAPRGVPPASCLLGWHRHPPQRGRRHAMHLTWHRRPSRRGRRSVRSREAPPRHPVRPFRCGSGREAGRGEGRRGRLGTAEFPLNEHRSTLSERAALLSAAARRCDGTERASSPDPSNPMARSGHAPGFQRGSETFGSRPTRKCRCASKPPAFAS
jgi:hypothetical protein